MPVRPIVGVVVLAVVLVGGSRSLWRARRAALFAPWERLTALPGMGDPAITKLGVAGRLRRDENPSCDDYC